MKIIIEIPEKLKNTITCGVITNEMIYTVCDAIKNGTSFDKLSERINLEKLGYPPSAGHYKAIMKVLQIIDKYNAEGEDKG